MVFGWGMYLITLCSSFNEQELVEKKDETNENI